MKIGIIGGGPAGLATAIKLKEYNFNVIVFEASSQNQITIGEHLAAEAIHEFKKLKIPEAILKNNSIPCTEVQSAWGNDEVHFNESVFNPFGAGYILSRPDFDSTLLNYCNSIGIDIKKDTRISKIEKIDNGWKLHTNKKVFYTDFIVDASGRNSKFNFELPIKKEKQDQLIGITKHLQLNSITSIESSHLLVEPTKNGWWYTVQIASGKMISTFMTDPKVLANHNGSSSDFWNQQLTISIHTKTRLNSIEIPETIFTQSAHSHISEEIHGQNWLKVGDAAQSFDPLSSAGILKGFKMGQQAAEAIYKYSIGGKNAFKIYEDNIRNQHQEYLKLKTEYYAQETRWLQHPFWYKRNLQIKNIKHFTIIPMHKLQVSPIISEEKIAFLQLQIPEINFKLLLESLTENSTIREAVHLYLIKMKATQMNPWLLHALESLKIIGSISPLVKKEEIH
jgi:flavin-dependent dehydrogenase